MTSLETATPSAGPRPKLVLYIGEKCPSCALAVEVAERARVEFPHVDVSVVDLGVSSEEQPEGVFAVPTFLLDGTVVSLGTPSWERLAPLLAVALGARPVGQRRASMTSQRTAHPVAEQTKVDYLSETDLFQDLTARDLEQLERNTAMTTCSRGTVFYTPGETGEVLFILKQGRVSLYRMTAEGKKLVTATVEPGTVFGEMSLIGQGMDAFAEAADECTLCVMSRTDVERLLLDHPTVSIRLLELLARRLDEAEERLADVAYKSVPARIAATLLRLSGDDGAPVRLSHQDIADMVGTYRETAPRILNEMRSEGLVELKRMLIEIVDRNGLEALAEQPV